MQKIPKNAIAQGMSCIVVGGEADGLLLESVDPTQSHMALSRPDHLKPLASSTQVQPEIATKEDVYVIHPIGLQNDNGSRALFGIAVVEGQELSWAFSQLVIGFVENTTAKLLEETQNLTIN